MAIVTGKLLATGENLDQTRNLIGLLQQFSVFLILGVFAGLLAANLNPHLYEEIVDFHVFGDSAVLFGHTVTVHFLINGMFMVFFFGIAAKEITESILPGGALNPVQKAINPIFGTIGGVLGPAGTYLLLAFVYYGGTEDFATVANGWAIPTATDIALAWLVARLVFGYRHPAVNFLLLLAVADDGIGLGIIAVFYPDPELPVMPAWLLLTVAGMGVAFAMRRMGVASWVPYVAIAGTLSWVGLIKSAVEPALALVPIVPFLPATVAQKTNPTELSGAVDDPHIVSEGIAGAHHSNSPLEMFEGQLKLFVDVGLFFFAFVNAGVTFASIGAVTLIVLVSLIAGKTVGITLFSWLAVKLGFPLPTGMDIRHLAVAGLIAGIGLTVALFVAGKAFAGPPFQDPAKMGAVLSGGVALLAIAAGAALKVKGQDNPPG